MAVLSCFRLGGTKNALRFRRGEDVDLSYKIKLFAAQFGIVCLSALIACVPLIPALEDLFVNGLAYTGDMKMFTGFVDKKRHSKIIRGYMAARSHSGDTSTAMSWELIRQSVSAMFTNDNRGVTGAKQSFYGNDASCVFKYFVRPMEPQATFVWVLGLAPHCTCITLVAVCHLIIAIISSRDQVETVDWVKKNRRMQSKITAIIVSDVSCWVPFLVCCVLHTAEVVDMTSWYQTFSIAILPLNSVFNPILYTDLYNKLMFDLVGPYFKVLKERFGNLLTTFTGNFGTRNDVLAAVGEVQGPETGKVCEVQDPVNGKICENQDPGSAKVCEVQDPGSGKIFEVQDSGSGEICEVLDPGSGETCELQDPGSGKICEVQNSGSGEICEVLDSESGKICQVQDSGSGKVCEVQGPGSGEVCEVLDSESGKICEVQDPGSDEVCEVQDPGSGEI
eukprot:sb/3464657/